MTNIVEVDKKISGVYQFDKYHIEKYLYNEKEKEIIVLNIESQDGLSSLDKEKNLQPKVKACLFLEKSSSKQ